MNNEQDDKLNKGVKEIRNVIMTGEEKKRMLEYILNSSILHQKHTRSPYVVYSFFQKIKERKLVYYGLISCLVLALGGGTVSASYGSLPGNMLYPVKVSVVEPIYSAFMFSTKAKAQYESSLAEKRLIEAETLASQDKLDLLKEEKLNVLLQTHTNALKKEISKLREDSSTDNEETEDDITIEFEAKMKAHARILNVINEHEDNKENENNGGESTRNKKIIKAAENSANSLRIGDNNKEKETTSEQYQKRKKAVESLINKAVTDVKESKIKKSRIKQKIFDNTHERMNEAVKSLERAYEDEREENYKEAYKKLLDSESSAREARILLKAGIRLDDEDDRESEKREGGEED